MGVMRNAYIIVVRIPGGRADHLEETGVKGDIILEQILEKQKVSVWSVTNGIRIGLSGGVF
jgi:hypothetical protein